MVARVARGGRYDVDAHVGPDAQGSQPLRSICRFGRNFAGCNVIGAVNCRSSLFRLSPSWANPSSYILLQEDSPRPRNRTCHD
jgi:hypothetical protein